MSLDKKPKPVCWKRKKITFEQKREIIEKREQGVSVAELSRTYNRTTSTICTILKNKEKIKQSDTAKGLTRFSPQRSHILDDVETLLIKWIGEMEKSGEFLNENKICSKAKELFTDLRQQTPGSSSAPDEVFKGSHGWFEKFKRRTGILGGDTVDKEAADTFISYFRKIVENEDYVPQQVFNCDETGLYWKKIPKPTEEDKTLEKDRIVLLFCSNASGDLKLKPLSIYHTETPTAFKTCKVQKSSLNVMWRSNTKGCMTRNILTDWINEVFGPSVKKYLLDSNLPLRAMLVMDNARSHLSGIEDNILDEFKYIKIQYLPPSTNSLIQPMNQGIVSSFKKLYTKELFEHCFEVTEGTNLTLQEFWNDHFHIVACLKLIDKAWDGVTKQTLLQAWRVLWPESSDFDFEEFETVTVEPIVNEIVSLANVMGLSVKDCDVKGFVEENEEFSSNHKYVSLLSVGREEEIEGEKKKEKVEEQTLDDVKEMLSAWDVVASYVEKHHPDKEMASRAINSFSEDVLSYFHQSLK